MVRSIVIFTGSTIFFFWAFNNGWVIDHILDPFTSATAAVSAWMFRVAGQNATVYGQAIKVNETVVTIATGCNGVEALGLYCAAVLALPTRQGMRLLGLGLGLVGILLINQIRIVGLVLVAMFRPDFLFEAHNYVGQTFVIVLGMALWIFWAERYGRVTGAPAD